MLAGLKLGQPTPAQKAEIETEYKRYYPAKKLNKRCKNCWTDALREIIYAKKAAGSYVIKRGCAVFYNAKVYSLNQMPTELAKQFISEHPEQAFKFEFIK